MRGVFSQVAVCLLLVTASIVGATGTATADTGDFLAGQECELRGLASLIPGFDMAQCQTPQQYQNATQADIYMDGLGIKDNLDQHEASMANTMDSSRKLTWCRAKADTIEGIENGDSESEALTEVNDTVDSYYAGIQWNYLQTTNTTLSQVRYMSSVSRDAGGKFVRVPQSDGVTGGHDWGWAWNPGAYEATQTQTVTLIAPVDGTETVDVVEMMDVMNSAETSTERFWDTETPDSSSITEIGVTDPETDEVTKIYDEQDWTQTYQNILTTHEDMKSQTNEYTRQMYAEHEQGDFEDVDTETLHSACSMSTLSTDQDTTGSYAELRAAIGLMGFDTDANTSFTVDYTPRADDGNLTSETVRLEGGLMTDWKPEATDGEYRKGETYDTADTDERVLFVAQTSNDTSMVDTTDGASLEEFDGQFTIDSMRDASNGEEVNTTTTEDQNVQTANASRTAQEVNRVIEYRNTTTNNYGTTLPGGGGMPLPDLSSDYMLVFLLALAGVAYVLTNQK